MLSVETPATLIPETTYHVRAVALDEFGDIVAVGNDLTFTTEAALHPPTPADDDLAASPVGATDVLGNDSDPDADTLTVSANTQPLHGTAGCSAQGACVYTASPGYTGADSFDYTARDPGGKTKVANVAVTVTAASNTASLAARDDAAAIRAGSTGKLNVLDNDSGTGVSVTGSTQPQHGTSNCAPDGKCTYEPSPAFSGSDGFTYTVHRTRSDPRPRPGVSIVVAPADAHHTVAVTGKPAWIHGRPDPTRWPRPVGSRGRGESERDHGHRAQRTAPPGDLDHAERSQTLDPSSVKTATAGRLSPPPPRSAPPRHRRHSSARR